MNNAQWTHSPKKKVQLFSGSLEVSKQINVTQNCYQDEKLTGDYHPARQKIKLIKKTEQKLCFVAVPGHA